MYLCNYMYICINIYIYIHRYVHLSCIILPILHHNNTCDADIPVLIFVNVISSRFEHNLISAIINI